MSDDVEKKIADLQHQIDELKAAHNEVADLFNAKALSKEPFSRKPQLGPTIDYTAHARMSADAAQKMALNVQGKYDPGAWARNRTTEPGGFGPGPAGKWPKGPTTVRPQDKLEVPRPPKSYWSK